MRSGERSVPPEELMRSGERSVPPEELMRSGERSVPPEKVRRPVPEKASEASRAPAIRGRTPGNRELAVAGGIAGAVLIGLPHRVSMPGWVAAAVISLGVVIVVGFVGAALRDFFQREP